MTEAALRKSPLERGDGRVEIGFAPAPGGARLAHLYQRTPLRALFPAAEPDDLPLGVLVTTSGGIAGGDRLALDLEIEAKARAVVLSQAAEKVYRSTGDNATIDVAIDVGRDAWLEWLPQETILFDGARLRRRFAISLADDARMLACDAVVLGRRARGEAFRHGLLHDRWEIRRSGELVWADALRLDDPRTIDHPAGLGGAAAFGTVLFAGSGAAEALALMRELTDGFARAGATRIGDLAIARLIADDPAALRAKLGEILATIRAELAGLPRRLPKLWQC
jgi:urease accessory protein